MTAEPVVRYAEPRGKPLAQPPMVACILLTRDRPAMAARAVRCFRAQTYDSIRRILIILDSGTTLSRYMIGGPNLRGQSIGALRNFACRWAADLKADIIAHFDDDDFSSPTRLTEQVALLQSGDYDAVGYREMLFWDTRRVPHVCSYDDRESDCPVCVDEDQRQHEGRGEAWLYTHPKPDYMLGTSLCYWARTWQSKPFPNLPQPGNPNSACEDFVWQSGLRCKSVSSIGPQTDDMEPRMVATVHGGNARSVISPGNCFTRASAWDERLWRLIECA